MSAPKDSGQESRRHIAKVNKSSLPPDWEFGQIKGIDPTTYLCRVVIFRGDTGLEEVPGWHPIIKGQDGIRILQESYGKLSPGMCCIVHWRGDHPEPGKTFIQIIGKGPGCGSSALVTEQEPIDNVLPTGPFKLFSGGMMP